MKLFCCSCEKEITPKKTNGDVIYPHRKDLAHLVFWKCMVCGNYVGSHKTSGKPLGCIPSSELRRARKEIHKILDPIWKEKIIKRGNIYKKISRMLGYEFHTANIRNIEEARKIYRIIMGIKREIS